MLLVSIYARPQHFLFLKYTWKNVVLFCGAGPVTKCWYDLCSVGVCILEGSSVYLIENEVSVSFQKSELSSSSFFNSHFIILNHAFMPSGNTKSEVGVTCVQSGTISGEVLGLCKLWFWLFNNYHNTDLSLFRCEASYVFLMTKSFSNKS